MSSLQRFALLVLIAMQGMVAGVEGVAVSVKDHDTWSELWDTLWQYDIRDDDVVATTPLYAGETRYASFDPTGSRVAFFNKLPDGVYISVIPVGGGDITNLCKASTDQYWCAAAIIDWATDGHVYFTNNSKWYESDSTLHRISVDNPGSGAEVVYKFNNVVGAGALSVDASRGFFAFSNPQAMAKLSFEGGAPSIEEICSAGCGCGISPSGNHMVNFYGGSHVWYTMRTWDDPTAGWCSGGDLPAVGDYNDWCTNCQGFENTCTEDGANPMDPVYETVGRGASGNHNRFSANSDKWFCTDIGWWGGGRYHQCSGNQVLINWEDHKTILVSKNRRACIWQDPNDPNTSADDCTIEGWDHGAWTTNDGGDFYVTSPVEDIIPSMRGHVRARPSPSGKRAFAAARPVRMYDFRGARISSQPAPGVYIARHGQRMTAATALRIHHPRR